MTGGRAVSAARGLSLGAVLAITTRFVLPLGPEDPFRGTLIALPLIVAGFVALGSSAISRGGQPTPQSVVLAEWTSLAVVILAALGRTCLGLLGNPAILDGVLASGFLLLLGHRALRILIALRPLLE